MKEIKILFKKLITVICLYLSTLFPRNKKLIICGAWYGNKYDDNPKYFYEYLTNSCKDVKAFWITKDNDIYQKLKNEKKNVCLANSSMAKYLSLRAEYVCTSTGVSDIGEKNFKFLGGCYYINFWHGVPLKKIMYDDEYNTQKNAKLHKLKKAIEKYPFRNSFIVSTSEKVSNIYESAFKVKKNQIIQMGQPRNDYFYTEHVNNYRKRFHNKKIILYMPTHRNDGNTPINIKEIFNLNELNNWCKKNNCIFLIKKHFYHSKEEVIDNNKYSYIYEITNEKSETQVLLDAADILITDYSSCYIDYLLLNRPIIFYNYDLENYLKNDRKMYFDYNEITSGEKCENFNTLIYSLEKIIHGEDTYKNDREKNRDMFFCKSAQQEVSPIIFDTLMNIRKAKKNANGYITKN